MVARWLVYRNRYCLIQLDIFHGHQFPLRPLVHEAIAFSFFCAFTLEIDNLASPTARTVPYVSLVGVANSLAIGDFNRDGVLDLAVPIARRRRHSGRPTLRTGARL
jgi:hypothetical protein